MGNNISRVPKEAPVPVISDHIKNILVQHVATAKKTIGHLKSEMYNTVDEHDLTVDLIKRMMVKLHLLEATMQEQSAIVPRNQVLIMLEQLEESMRGITSARCCQLEAFHEAEIELQQQIDQCWNNRIFDYDCKESNNQNQYLLGYTKACVMNFQRKLEIQVDKVVARQQAHVAMTRIVKFMLNNQVKKIEEFETERKETVSAVIVAPNPILTNKPANHKQTDKPVETCVNEADGFKQYNPIPVPKETSNGNILSKNNVPVPYIRDLNDDNVSMVESLSRLLLEKPDLFKPIHRAFFKGKFRYNLIATHVSDGPIGYELFERRSILQSDSGLIEFQSKDCLSNTKQQRSVSDDAGKLIKVLKLNDVDSTALEVFKGIEIRDDGTYCKICNTYLPPSIIDIKLHVNGKKHKKESNLLSTVGMNDVVKDTTIVEYDHHKKEVGLQWNKQVPVIVKEPIALHVGDLKGTTSTSLIVENCKAIFCNICNISHPGDAKSIAMHVKGSTHQKKLANGNNSDVIEKIPEMKVINNKTICIVCNVKIPDGSDYIKSHIKGIVHKKNMKLSSNEKVNTQGQNDLPNTSKHFIKKENAEFCNLCTTKLSSGAGNTCVHGKSKIRPIQSTVLSKSSNKSNNISMLQGNNMPIVSSSHISETSLANCIGHTGIASQSRTFCKVCQINHPGGSDNIIIHVMSETHQKALIRDASKLKTVKKQSEMNQFFCKLCKTSIYGLANYTQHNKGKKHMLAIQMSHKIPK